MDRKMDRRKVAAWLAMMPKGQDGDALYTRSPIMLDCNGERADRGWVTEGPVALDSDGWALDQFGPV